MDRSSIGLRARLLLLVLFAVIPAIGLIGYSALHQRQHAVLDAERDALSLARQAAREQEHLITATQQLLAGLSRLPEIRRLDSAAACNRILAETQRPYPYYTNIGVATLNGDIFCDSQPKARAVNISDRSYFRRAVRLRGFSVGDYQTGRVPGTGIINFGYPVAGPDGKLHAVVYAALDLAWLGGLILSLDLPADSTVMTIDERGTILAHHPEPSKWVGQAMPEAPVISAALASHGEETAKLKGLDGLPRLHAFASLQREASDRFYVVVGIPNAVVFAAANADFARNLVLLVLVAVLALVVAWVGSNMYILGRLRAAETMARMAYYDGITGLPNHVLFDERLQRALAEGGMRRQSVALFVVGLNGFREINEALGFYQGDLLLKAIGTRIRSLMPPNVLVARMRGDEFAVLLPVKDPGGIGEVAQRVLEALNSAFVINNLDLGVSTAIGIAVFPRDGTESTAFLRRADVAMQQAKKSGQGYVFYAAEHDEDSTRRLSLAAELRRALEHNELVLFYQPKVDMRDGRVCGAEALVRWNHPGRGMLSPGEFIELAEHTGLIKPLTDWVIGVALRQSTVWREVGLEIPIAINLSARNLQDVELVHNVERLFAASGAGAGWLEFEITEGAVMRDARSAFDVLKHLSDMGITLFIDDFGTGYSSLGYLKKLPVDAMKIDKSFVIDMLTESDSAVIVRSTIGLAHDLGLKVVAEGVENQATWDRLAALGCDVAQGYFLSKPLPAEQLKDWIGQRVLSAKTAEGKGRWMPRR